MSGAAHIPRLVCWGYDRERKRKTPEKGCWDLIWPDGLFVALYRRDETKRWEVAPAGARWGNGSPDHHPGTRYSPAIPIPTVKTPTRREIIQVMTEWRQRELAAVAAIARGAGAEK